MIEDLTIATETSAPLSAVLERAAYAPVSNRVFLRITGSDATRWLNGMVTNSVTALMPGTGSYSFLLNAQGRIQGDCLIFREPSPANPATYLLVTDGTQAEAIGAHLDRFIIMDDVELTPAYADEGGLLLLGPEAGSHLPALHLPTPDPLQLVLADTLHGAVLLFSHPFRAVPSFELRAPAATIQAIEAELAAAGLPKTSSETLEDLRIYEGAPRIGTDIRDRELPQETNQTQALHFSKGCYLGQEIVERIHSRGQVHRIFTAFRLEGTLPTLPAALEANGKSVGELTSAAEVTLNDGPALLALGYCRREALETHATLIYPGGTAVQRSLPRSS